VTYILAYSDIQTTTLQQQRLQYRTTNFRIESGRNWKVVEPRISKWKVVEPQIFRMESCQTDKM
jgi:hypothetical protein